MKGPDTLIPLLDRRTKAPSGKIFWPDFLVQSPKKTGPPHDKGKRFKWMGRPYKQTSAYHWLHDAYEDGILVATMYCEKSTLKCLVEARNERIEFNGAFAEGERIVTRILDRRMPFADWLKKYS